MSRSKANKQLLAGDLGGTNTRLAVYSVDQGNWDPQSLMVYRNRNFQNFGDLLNEYLDRLEIEIDGICLGIAGPVSGNQVRLTNLNWEIIGSQLQENHSLEGVWLLNDLKALSYAVPNLGSDDQEVIRAGNPLKGKPIAVIAPGTGLGEGFLITLPEGFRAVSTEGGHTDFAPTNRQQEELARYLREQGMRVSYEKVCSGIGIPNLYRFLRDSGSVDVPPFLEERINQVDDPTPVLVEIALDDQVECELCDQVLDLFVEILGAEAGNLALKVLARGGVYIGGGIPPRILSKLREERFLNAFDNKDPHQELMSKIPVKVITNPAANLIGAAYFGLRQLSEG